MATRQLWRTVIADNEPCLVNAQLHDGGYQVQFTDLGRFWVETLSRAEIIRRAAELGSSIDASEGDQYQILLTKIQSAIDGDRGTTFDLRKPADGVNRELYLTASLPGSLPNLKWTVKLLETPPSALRSQLLAPVLSRVNELNQHMQLLIEELNAKDRIISRLADRLEMSGIDLTTVFPGLSTIKISRRKPQLTQLVGHVKGLAEFDRDSLLQQASPDHDLEEFGPKGVASALEDIMVAPFREPETRHSARLKQLEAPRRIPEVVAVEADLSTDDEMSSAGNEKQGSGSPVQLSPMDLNGRTQQSSLPPSNERTSSNIETGQADADQDAKSLVEQTTEPPSLPLRRTKGRLGILGGKKPSSGPSHPLIQESSEPLELKPKARLGSIGGKANRSRNDHSAADDLAQAQSNPQHDTKSNGRSTEQTSRSAVEDVTTSLGTSPLEPQDTERYRRETSQERADKRRDELKRELQANVKGPAKKKRRF